MKTQDLTRNDYRTGETYIILAGILEEIRITKPSRYWRVRLEEPKQMELINNDRYWRIRLEGPTRTALSHNAHHYEPPIINFYVTNPKLKIASIDVAFDKIRLREHIIRATTTHRPAWTINGDKFVANAYELADPKCFDRLFTDLYETIDHTNATLALMPKSLI